MKKYRNIGSAIFVFILVSASAVLSVGCKNNRITLSETLTAPHDNYTAAPAVTKASQTNTLEKTESAEAESAQSEAAAETEPETVTEPPAQPSATKAPDTSAVPETQAPQQTEAEKETPAPKPDVSAPKEFAGFVGTNQESYNPYGCDKDRAKELAERIENGKLSTQGLFKNTLFVGDSIIVGFADYKLANSGNVIANVGAMLSPHLSDNMQKIIDYNPEVLIIHYGLNEMGGEEHFVKSFIKELRAELTVLKEELPYTKIVVMSMWPIKDSAAAKQPRLANLPNYNTEIRKLCVELGVAYDERSELFAANPDWYQYDGIHCVKQMYLTWINDFITDMGLY